MPLIRSAVKMYYKGELMFGNSVFECDESDVEDLEVMGLGKRLTPAETREHRRKNQKVEKTVTEDDVKPVTEPTAESSLPTPRRGRYNRTDMRAEDE